MTEEIVTTKIEKASEGARIKIKEEEVEEMREEEEMIENLDAAEEEVDKEGREGLPEMPSPLMTGTISRKIRTNLEKKDLDQAAMKEISHLETIVALEEAEDAAVVKKISETSTWTKTRIATTPPRSQSSSPTSTTTRMMIRTLTAPEVEEEVAEAATVAQATVVENVAVVVEEDAAVEDVVAEEILEVGSMTRRIRPPRNIADFSKL